MPRAVRTVSPCGASRLRSRLTYCSIALALRSSSKPASDSMIACLATTLPARRNRISSRPSSRGRNIERRAAGGKGARVEVEGDVAEATSGRAQPGLPPQQHAHARLELADVEGLDHVVVGAEIEPAHPLVQRRRAPSGSAPPALVLARAHRAQHVEPVHLRQVEVEDDEVETLGREHRIGRCAVADDVDGIAAAAQDGGKPLRQAACCPRPRECANPMSPPTHSSRPSMPLVNGAVAAARSFHASCCSCLRRSLLIFACRPLPSRSLFPALSTAMPTRAIVVVYSSLDEPLAGR